MLLEKIALTHFRNLEKLEFSPDQHFNIFFGRNAQGKTNILEAIYLLAHLKSFRFTNNEDFIAYNHDFCSVNGLIKNNDVFRNINLSIDKRNKNVKIDGKKPQTNKEFYGLLRCVIFSPEEVSWLKGYPAARRAFLDRAIYQSSPLFINVVIEYNRLLKQRNKLLKDGKNDREISPWTEGLIQAGSRIRIERLKYLNKILPLLKNTFSRITEGKEVVDLTFNFSEDSYESLTQLFRDELLKLEPREKSLGQTLSGPHRDDPLFLLNGKPIRRFGSQGQLRSFILAFKVAQIMDIEQIIGEPPVLLLDDMTGELDDLRQKYLFEFLLQQRAQVFITTTDITSSFYKKMGNGRFFMIDNGQIGKIVNSGEIYE